MAKPTTRYATVMDAVPGVFVGLESHLQTLVKLLCVEMHRAFTTQGASIPPWRSKESFLSKWKVPHAHREARVASSPGRHRAGVCKAARPPSRRPSANGGCQAVAAIKRVSSFCRVSSQGALSSQSEAGSAEHSVVAPL